MPTYDYECKKCKNIQEEFHGILEKKKIKCNECGSVCKMKFSSSGQFVLKGVVWPSKEH